MKIINNIKNLLNKDLFKRIRLKQNQIVLSVIAIMLVAAGYLNYSSQISKEVSSENQNNIEEYAGIGDAKLVDSEKVVDNSISETNNINELVSNEDDGSIQENNTVETNSEGTDNDYYTSSRLQRENMYSQMIETYENILQNPNISEDQKSISSQEIANINNTKNAIMIAENLIKTKGFEDVVIFINDKNVNLVVKDDNLEQNEIAQLQNIISRELNVEISNIHISKK